MQLLDKKVRVLLWTSVLVSVLFVAGIPMIIFGASRGVSLLLVAGIILTGGGFYATPLLWVAYGGQVVYRRLVYAVCREHILRTSELATQLGKGEEQTCQMIRVCIQKYYLPGYLFDGEVLTLNENTDPHQQLRSFVCESCGARFACEPGQPAVCPYCKTVAKED